MLLYGGGGSIDSEDGVLYGGGVDSEVVLLYGGGGGVD